MSEQLTNIDRFNITALKLFDQLYDSFPNPIDIDPKELGVTASPDDAEFIEAFKIIVYAENAVTWLVEEGFVRCESPKVGSRFQKVRLTLKGLTVLGYLPTSVRPQDLPEPLIKRIKRSLASGAEKAGTEAVKGLLMEVFKLAMSPAAGHAATSIIQA